MPNRCTNSVRLSCKSHADLDKILNAIRGIWLWKTFIPRPKEVQDDWDLEVKYGWANWEEERLEKYWYKDPRDWKEDWYEKCPYKQLWYNWQHDNWWSKWDFSESENWMPDIYEWDNWKVYCELFYESARTPHLPLREKVSKEVWCRVELSFDEPWCDFSWEYIWDDWDLIQQVDYDDWFYGNWKECCICKWKYDNSNPDDWWDEHHTVCIYCWEDLDSKRKKDVSNTSERKS